jgi:hypothetical protein
MLYGATFGEATDLVPLAKSWIHPPELQVIEGSVESRGYDVSQRAYVLTCPSVGQCDDLTVRLEAGPSSPLVNACLIFVGWGGGRIGISLDGRELDPGKEVRISHERTLDGTDLVIWLDRESTEPATLKITKDIASSRQES